MEPILLLSFPDQSSFDSCSRPRFLSFAPLLSPVPTLEQLLPLRSVRHVKLASTVCVFSLLFSDKTPPAHRTLVSVLTVPHAALNPPSNGILIPYF
ncbi:uncharacterized [Tachysurus ichikawai]